MIAVDTNVIVRFLVADDMDQSERSTHLFATETIWIPHTVLMETEWVLRGAYKYSRLEIYSALRGLLLLKNVLCENKEGVFSVLEHYEKGADIADALHLLSLPTSVRGFYTFDRKMKRFFNEDLESIFSP
jgi:predicted nucleic-acid-binding protein